MKLKLLIIPTIVSLLPLSSAQANCDLGHYVFQDQHGNEAIVKGIKECFGWFNRDRETLSSQRGACFSERDAEHHIKLQSSKYDTRIVGSRVFTILYKDRFVNISETAIVGSPWLSYEVDPDLRKIDLPAFKDGGTFYELLGGGEVRFDFTEDAPGGFDEPKLLYKTLLGTQFIFKRCQN